MTGTGSRLRKRNRLFFAMLPQIIPPGCRPERFDGSAFAT